MPFFFSFNKKFLDDPGLTGSG